MANELEQIAKQFVMDEINGSNIVALLQADYALGQSDQREEIVNLKQENHRLLEAGVHQTLRAEETASRNEQLQVMVTERDAELHDLQATFDLHWDADMRAIKRWQAAHPGNDLVWPDHVDLVMWLAEQQVETLAAGLEATQKLTAAESRITQLEATIAESLRESLGEGA